MRLESEGCRNFGCRGASGNRDEKDPEVVMVEFVDKQVEELKKLWSNKRQLAFQGLNLAMIVLSALMIWKSLMVVTKSESPVVVVLR